MTTAVSQNQPVNPGFFTTCCSKIDAFCQMIHNLAMKVIQALGRCCGFNTTGAVRNPTVGAHARNVSEFYRDLLPNHNNFTLEQILSWDNERLEQDHNYIQWLFPLQSQSNYNTTAPLLDAATIQTFNNDQALRDRLLVAFKRMLHFYGLQIDEPSGAIIRAPNFDERAAVWLTQGNHNFLRITRIIHSLGLLGLTHHARAFQNIMLQIAHEEGAGIVGRGTITHWHRAYQGNIAP
jgi:hypothetical protein